METIVLDAFSQAAYRSFVPTETIAKNKEFSKIVIGGLAILGIGVVIYQWRKYSDKVSNEIKKARPVVES
tara:strand:+ start:705 stop:914 length:210 start_codon:yes stop_codon:yes gene_type:complete